MIARILLTLFLAGAILFSVYGILATFELLSPGEGWKWRSLYISIIVVALGIIAWTWKRRTG